MNILALDIATQCGWALHRRGVGSIGGSEAFARRPKDAPGRRWLNFRGWLSDTVRSAGGEIHVCYYERATQMPGQHAAAHVYGGFLAMLEAWAAMHNIRLEAVSPSTIKKHWTGKGNANKAAMIAEAERRGLHPVDDNHADAMALLSYAVEMEALT